MIAPAAFNSAYSSHLSVYGTCPPCPPSPPARTAEEEEEEEESSARWKTSAPMQWPPDLVLLWARTHSVLARSLFVPSGLSLICAAFSALHSADTRGSVFFTMRTRWPAGPSSVTVLDARCGTGRDNAALEAAALAAAMKAEVKEEDEYEKRQMMMMMMMMRMRRTRRRKRLRNPAATF